MTHAAAASASDDDLDAPVDTEIAACLNLAAPRSFFLFAGAGSGKTRSLVKALEHIQKTQRDALQSRGQRVSVITFTNAASEEIKRRLRFDPLIDVRTIHSFAWSLIDGLHRDIREWLRVTIAASIAELEAKEASGRKGTAASEDRLRRITSRKKRFQNLDTIKRFTYSPTGDNRTRDALNHAEVLQITADFLKHKPAMQSILVGRHPIVLIDESQDTNRHLIDALFAVQAAQKNRFVLGLLGDTMQRIYGEGKDGLGQNLPADWVTPAKQLNHRCPIRVIGLINKVRSPVDHHQQKPRTDASLGFVRVFVLPSTTSDKPAVEQKISEHMTRITGDNSWNQPAAVKTLTLEHRMAAARLHFLEMFAPLYEVDSWRTSFLEGELAASRFFTKQIQPLVDAKRSGDRFALARIAKAISPLLSVDVLRGQGNKEEQLERVRLAIDELMSLWKDGADPSLGQVLRSVSKTGLLLVPEMLEAHVLDDDASSPPDSDEGTERERERFAAIQEFLEAPASQIPRFAAYMTGKAHFDTHQGVKGLEFERVMVVMDDSEAKGFMFKYESLFGGKAAGDKTVETTRRLFYVTCSRAKKSLALVAYAQDPRRVREFLLSEAWFEDAEIVSDLS
jgi:DNA helicase II / ATP-dependent DNA helicase PcrA